MSPSAASPPVMQTAGRPPPYRVYDAAVSDVRTGVPHDRRMPPSRRSPFMPCAQCPFSGCGMVAMNSSVALYDDPVFHGAVLALHRRLKSAVRCSFGLGALRQSCFSCSLCAASSVSPCAVALAVGAACCADVAHCVDATRCVGAACCVVGFTFRLALLILCGKLRALPLPASCACWFAVNVR